MVSRAMINSGRAQRGGDVGIKPQQKPDWINVRYEINNSVMIRENGVR